MQGFVIGKTEGPCSACGQATTVERVNVTLWLGSELNVVEDVPASVCPSCGLEHFDSETEARLARLSEAGFPQWQALRVMPVAVFTLYGDGAAESVVAPVKKAGAI